MMPAAALLAEFDAFGLGLAIRHLGEGGLQGLIELGSLIGKDADKDRVRGGTGGGMLGSARVTLQVELVGL